MGSNELSSLCDILESQLAKLLDESGELLALAHEKQALLVDGEDYDVLRDITAREERHADVLSRLEKERIALCSKMAPMLGLDPSDTTISEIIGLVDPIDGQKLRAAASKLSECIEELRSTNSLNRDLIEMKMSYAAFMLDTFSYSSEGPTNTYGSSGQEGDPFDAELSSIFDSEV